jgi:hypothetical protein
MDSHEIFAAAAEEFNAPKHRRCHSPMESLFQVLSYGSRHILKSGAAGSFETLAFIYQTTRRYVSQYRNDHIHHCEILRSLRNKLYSYETIVLFHPNLQPCHFGPEFQIEKPLYFIARDDKLQRNHPHLFSFSSV